MLGTTSKTLPRLPRSRLPRSSSSSFSQLLPRWNAWSRAGRSVFGWERAGWVWFPTASTRPAHRCRRFGAPRHGVRPTLLGQALRQMERSRILCGFVIRKDNRPRQQLRSRYCSTANETTRKRVVQHGGFCWAARQGHRRWTIGLPSPGSRPRCWETLYGRSLLLPAS